MTTILQISDTHIARPGQRVSGCLDTAGSLEKLVDFITTYNAQFGPIDAILVSGDLSDDGSAESYEYFKTLMSPLQVPIFAIPGNHDLREPMRRAFSDRGYLPSTGKLNWHQRVGDIDMIGLDTLVEGSGGGEIDAASLSFLENALVASQVRPVLLALHHPPFQSGIAFMDRIGLERIHELATVLNKVKFEVRVVCGHVHNTMVATVGGKTALSCPSPCSCFSFNVAKDAPVGFLNQEDGFMVHRWQDGFLSVRVPISAGPGPLPF